MALLPGFCGLRHGGIKRGMETQIRNLAFGESSKQNCVLFTALEYCKQILKAWQCD